MKATLLFVALGVSSLQSSQPVTLVARHAKGDVFEEKESFWSFASKAALDGGDERPSFAWTNATARVGRAAGEQIGASETVLLDEVLAVKDEKRVRVKRTFVASSTTLFEESIPRPRSAAFEGQTAILVADGDGVRIEGELEGAEELDESDLRLASRWERILPEGPEPVEVGDGWSLSEEVARSLLKGMDLTRATAECRLLGIDASAEEKPARIRLELWATAAAGLEETCEIKATGVASWSTEAGHLVEVTLSGERKVTKLDGGEEISTFGISHVVRKIE